MELTETQQSTLRTAQQELRDAEQSIVMARLSFARQLGFTFGGARDMYGVLGYADTITTAMYRARYERGGLASRIVDARPAATWRGEGDLYEDQKATTKTEFEKIWYQLNDIHKIWPVFQRTDKLAQIGEYAVLLIGAEGELNTELPKGKPEKLLYLQPFDDEDAKVETFEEDLTNVRWGRPKTYMLKRSSLSTNQRSQLSTAALSKPVHWTRVIHIPAEGFLDDEVYGPPCLQNVWNYLDDLEKTVGGGAEAFWHRANQGTHLDIDKDTAFANEQDFEAQVAALKKQADDYKNQLTRWIYSRGTTVKQLGSDTSDFKNPKDAIVSLIAGTKGIPQRILVGSEQGSLASDQDRDNWHDQIGDRRTSYAGPYIVRQTIDRLIQYAYMPKPKEYSTKWPDVKNMSQNERLDAAEKAAKLNDHGETVITADEIRERFLEMEPIDLSQLQAQSNPQDQQLQQLTAALRKGGTLSIAVRS